MTRPFESARIGALDLPNRFVRSATWEGLAGPGGEVTEPLVGLIRELARGEVGLIVASHAFVAPEGRARPRQLGAHDDGLIPGLARLVAAAHAGGSRIAAQLAHAGFQADPAVTGLPRVAPSARVPGEDRAAQELSPEGIARVASAFGQAALRAREAGFDAVQVHAAHTYLLSQFLSPCFNRRRDGYGGPVENRVRALLEVLAAVRGAVGGDYPVLVKVNSADFLEGGLEEADSIEACRRLARAGMDAIELSGGNLRVPRFHPARPGRILPEEEGYYRATAGSLRPGLGCPLILVGGIRSPGTAERLLADGVADFIALSRPLVCEPDLVRRWAAGDRRPSLCQSDNRCYEPILAGDGIACMTRRGVRLGADVGRR